MNWLAIFNRDSSLLCIFMHWCYECIVVMSINVVWLIERLFQLSLILLLKTNILIFQYPVYTVFKQFSINQLVTSAIDRLTSNQQCIGKILNHYYKIHDSNSVRNKDNTFRSFVFLVVNIAQVWYGILGFNVPLDTV